MKLGNWSVLQTICFLLVVSTPITEANCSCGQSQTTQRVCAFTFRGECLLWTDQTTCHNCPAGQWSSTHAHTCSNCGPGQYSPSARSCSCTTCLPGRFSSGDTNTGCSTCEAGYMPDSSMDECSECQAGKYGIDGVSCEDCPIGKYS